MVYTPLWSRSFMQVELCWNISYFYWYCFSGEDCLQMSISIYCASLFILHTHGGGLFVKISRELCDILISSLPWSDVRYSYVTLAPLHIVSLLHLHSNFPCSVMPFEAWRHFPASRSPQQSDWHFCANLTTEGPATKERPRGSVSLAL